MLYSVRLIRLILVILVSTAVLSGCLVKKKDVEKIYRATDFPRIYMDGDQITYNVTATRQIGSATPQTLSGTLVVKWSSHATITRLFLPTPVTVLEEKSTLTLFGEEPKEIIRYITQNATSGEISLYAYDSSVLDEYYWLDNDGTMNAGENPQPFVIFPSDPVNGISIGDMTSIEFNIMEGCDDDGTCNDPVGQFIDSQNVVGDSTRVETSLGDFMNPFQITFLGSGNPSTNPDLPTYLDIRGLCGLKNTTFNGSMYVIPEIGIIKMTNHCSELDSITDINYTIIINSTNFSY